MLDDILASGLRLVVCGTAAGKRSGELKQYYAGPGNKFWKTLAEVGLTPHRMEPAEAASLLGFGIGLTDLVKDQSGADSRISFSDLDRLALREKVEALRPDVLCFNGKRAAQEFFKRAPIGYGLQAERIGRTRLFVAPSTSAAANGAWDPSLWRELSAVVRAG